MPYKKIGHFHTESLHELWNDLTPFFEEIASEARDMTVVEVGAPDDPDREPELWRDDYELDDNGWLEAGVFCDIWAANDAAAGFPDGEALGIFDYADQQAKLVVRMNDSNE